MNKLSNKLMGILLLILPLYFFSCSDDEDGPKVLLPKAEGFYVFGDNTVAAEPSEPAARMALAQLDPGHGPSFADSVYGKYMYIGAHSKIQFALVNEDGDGTLFGADEVIVENGVEAGISVNDDIIHGTLGKNEDEIEVTNEGLYYVFADLNTLTFVLTEVKPQIIGDAVKPDGWDAGVPLTLKSISMTEVVWEATNVEMAYGGGYKYRFNDGWASYQDENFATHSHLGIEDYGVAWENQEVGTVGWFPSTIPSFAKGLYTINMKYTHNPVGEGTWTPTVTKTGEVVTDYSTTQVGFFGNAFYLSSGAEGAWAEQGGVKTPTKSGNVYTWTWNDFDLIQDREFIIREDGIWTGVLVVFNGATQAGDGFSAKITKATGSDNFYVTTGGVYDISLAIDGVTNAKTLTINSN